MIKTQPLNTLTANDASYQEFLNSALLHATKNNQIHILKQLISAGADVNVVDENDYSVLMLATDNFYIDIVNILLSAHADVNFMNHKNETALLLSSIHNNSEINVLLIETLLAAGANCNVADNLTDTPLHNVCFGSYLDADIQAAKILLSAGANINAVNNKGNTPLIYACQNNKKDVVRFLLSQGADIDHFDHEGKTALFYACENQYAQIVEDLLIANADISIKSYEGETAESKGDEIIRQIFKEQKYSLKGSLEILFRKRDYAIYKKFKSTEDEIQVIQEVSEFSANCILSNIQFIQNNLDKLDTNLIFKDIFFEFANLIAALSNDKKNDALAHSLRQLSADMGHEVAMHIMEKFPLPNKNDTSIGVNQVTSLVSQFKLFDKAQTVKQSIDIQLSETEYKDAGLKFL